MLILASLVAGCSIVVMPAQLTSSDSASRRELVTAAAAAGAAGATRCEVVAPDDIRALLRVEAQWQSCGADESCLAEVGNALGANRLLSVAARRWPDRWVVEARELDLNTGAVLGRAEREATPDGASLREASRGAGAAAVAPSPLPAVLLWSGGGLAAAGAAALAGTAGLWGYAADTVSRAEVPGADKARAISLAGTLPLAAAVAGAAVAAGGGLMLVATLTEEDDR